MSVALKLRIPIISRIQDSSSTITDSKSQDSAFHKQIVFAVPVSVLPYMEGNNSHKQTNKNNYFIWG